MKHLPCIFQLAAWFAIFGGIVSCAAITENPIAIREVTSIESISRNCSNYTFFMSTSHSSPNNYSEKNVKLLASKFTEFSKMLVEDDCVVFVGSGNKFNVALGMTLADKINRIYGETMNYNDGPYIVFTTKHPDDIAQSKDDIVVFSFSKIHPDYINDVIGELTQIVRRYEYLKDRENYKITQFWYNIKTVWHEMGMSDELKKTVIKWVQRRVEARNLLAPVILIG